jgi:hypothetical protein
MVRSVLSYCAAGAGMGFYVFGVTAKGVGCVLEKMGTMLINAGTNSGHPREDTSNDYAIALSLADEEERLASHDAPERAQIDADERERVLTAVRAAERAERAECAERAEHAERERVLNVTRAAQAAERERVLNVTRAAQAAERERVLTAVRVAEAVERERRAALDILCATDEALVQEIAEKEIRNHREFSSAALDHVPERTKESQWDTDVFLMRPETRQGYAERMMDIERQTAMIHESNRRSAMYTNKF